MSVRGYRRKYRNLNAFLNTEKGYEKKTDGYPQIDIEGDTTYNCKKRKDAWERAVEAPAPDRYEKNVFKEKDADLYDGGNPGCIRRICRQ